MSEELPPNEGEQIRIPMPPSHAEPVVLTAGALRHLRGTVPWLRFFAILGFIYVALMILMGLGMGIAGIVAQDVGMIAIMAIYPIMAAVYVLPLVYLQRYASNLRALVTAPEAASLERTLEAQRSFWKTLGILTVVFLALGLALFVLGIAAGLLLPILARG